MGLRLPAEWRPRETFLQKTTRLSERTIVVLSTNDVEYGCDHQPILRKIDGREYPFILHKGFSL